MSGWLKQVGSNKYVTECLIFYGDSGSNVNSTQLKNYAGVHCELDYRLFSFKPSIGMKS